MNQEQLPKAKISIDEIINKSFYYWKSTLVFQFIISVLYFGLIIITGLQLWQYYFGDRMYLFTPELMQKPVEFKQKIDELLLTENGGYFQLFISLIRASLFPLNIGLLKIYSLIDEGKKPQFSDILDGYSGSNFFKFWGYAVFWDVIFGFGLSLLFFPGIFWAFITLFVSPLLYFTPMRMVEAIRISTKVIVGNWAVILPCVIVAFLFSYSGFIMFFVGFLFTFPFWNAMIYVLFKKFFSIKFV